VVEDEMVTVGVFDWLYDTTLLVTESKVWLLLIGDFDEVVTGSSTVEEVSMLDIPYGADDVSLLVINVKVRLFVVGDAG
jgi:hypothetical protein